MPDPYERKMSARAADEKCVSCMARMRRLHVDTSAPLCDTLRTYSGVSDMTIIHYIELSFLLAFGLLGLLT